MIADFDAALEFFVCGPVCKKVKAVIYARTNQRSSKHKCDYMHLMEHSEGCNYGNSKRNQN